MGAGSVWKRIPGRACVHGAGSWLQARLGNCFLIKSEFNSIALKESASLFSMGHMEQVVLQTPSGRSRMQPQAQHGTGTTGTGV